MDEIRPFAGASHSPEEVVEQIKSNKSSLIKSSKRIYTKCHGKQIKELLH
jgi:translation initiation factor 2B subunit (eIF-2B alpha/beta/delta family)